MVAMGYKFRAPRSDNVKEWTRIEEALTTGQDYEIPTVRKKQEKPPITNRVRNLRQEKAEKLMAIV